MSIDLSIESDQPLASRHQDLSAAGIRADMPRVQPAAYPGLGSSFMRLASTHARARRDAR